MTKIASVWAVEHGEYSSYRIVAIYSTKERAEAFRDKINAINNGADDDDEASIKEFPLDPAFEQLNDGLQPYWVTMHRDGTTQEVTRRAFNLEREEDNSGHNLAYASSEMKELVLVSGVWAKDKEHAVKIVNERRTQLIASGEWPAS